MSPNIIANNPFNSLIRDIPEYGKYYSLKALNDPRVERLPYSIRILLESALRNCDEFEIRKSDVEKILNWEITSKESTEIPFKPSRVILQDFTGVPAAVDFAALRDAMCRLEGDPEKINPLVPVDLVIDHSIQVDYSRDKYALEKNQNIEFMRNEERFSFLKWAASAFKNMLIIPPGSGIVHQVNLEYLARVVFNTNNLLYPDSVVGTDSHTTMIDGLGVVGWGVGGIEAEAVMLGQPISMVIPEVIGFELKDSLPLCSTATDLVLTITKILRSEGVVGKFVEFFGEGCKNLTLADRATIGNMSPEYGATMGFFPVDNETITYLKQSGRTENTISMIIKYLKSQELFREYTEKDNKIKYSHILTLSLSTVVPCCAGPKRPHDNIPLNNMSSDFKSCLINPIGFKGFNLDKKKLDQKVSISYKDINYEIKHGSIVIAAITSCTNTSNPSVMLGAGLLAKNAIENGLNVMPYIKTSLSPGSEVCFNYLKISGLLNYLEKLGFYTTGFGCQTCIGNSGELDIEVSTAITQNQLVAAAVLSGNRNFEGRVHPLTRANYLMSPVLVVAYALAGRIDIDFDKEPLGINNNGNPIFLKNIWPSINDIRAMEKNCVTPELFRNVYMNISKGGSESWKNLNIANTKLYPWSNKSTYIHNPPFFQSMTKKIPGFPILSNMYCLLNLGDSITTDHISPAGSIAKNSSAAKFLMDHGIDSNDFNSYGSRRGNDEIMARGTFANIRLTNKLASKPGPYTVHMITKEELFVYDVAQKYINTPLVILAGKEYGSGSSRDWAAKGPYLLGVRVVIAESFERIHRRMGILPLQFTEGENADKLNLTGEEIFDIILPYDMIPNEKIFVKYKHESRKGTFMTTSRIDTEVEVEYYRNGGILNYVLRKLLIS